MIKQLFQVDEIVHIFDVRMRDDMLWNAKQVFQVFETARGAVINLMF